MAQAFLFMRRQANSFMHFGHKNGSPFHVLAPSSGTTFLLVPWCFCFYFQQKMKRYIFGIFLRSNFWQFNAGPGNSFNVIWLFMANKWKRCALHVQQIPVQFAVFGFLSRVSVCDSRPSPSSLHSTESGLFQATCSACWPSPPIGGIFRTLSTAAHFNFRLLAAQIEFSIGPTILGLFQQLSLAGAKSASLFGFTLDAPPGMVAPWIIYDFGQSFPPFFAFIWFSAVTFGAACICGQVKWRFSSRL